MHVLHQILTPRLSLQFHCLADGFGLLTQALTMVQALASRSFNVAKLLDNGHTSSILQRSCFASGFGMFSSGGQLWKLVLCSRPHHEVELP